MATDPDTIDDDVLDLEGFEADDGAPQEGDEQQDDVGDTDATDENAVLRALRASNREKERRIAELERQTKPKPVDPGPRPTLEAFDYDEGKFNDAIDTWHETRRAATEAAKPEDTGVEQHWTESVAAFQTARTALTASNPRAEDIILDVDRAFTPAQTACLIQAFGDKAPAMMVRIGSDPDKMEALADITNPIRFTAEVVRMENAAVRQRPALDEPVRGKAVVNRSNDAQLAKLEKEAARTGDRTALIRYRKSQNKA
ncbi:MAG: hypothetical protein V4696_07510 [Pseudomonadota bacterium]